MESKILFNLGKEGIGTYAGINLLFDGVDDLVDASPLVLVLCTALDDAEAFEDVDDVVNAPTLHTQLFGALVQI